MGPVERIGAESFSGSRLSRSGTWAVGFLADWCPFCRSFEPEFAKLALRDGASRVVADLTDEDNPLWERFRIEIVPSVIVFQDGDPIFRVDGKGGYGLDAADLASVRAAVSGTRSRDRAESL